RRSFVASHVVAGVLALAVLPAYLFTQPAVSIEAALVYLWLCVPIGVAALAAHSGALTRAHIFSTLGLAGLVIYVASITGGLDSFAAYWLIAIPAEAALSGSLAVVGVSAGVSILGILFLGVAIPGMAGADGMAVLGALTASAYVAAIMFGGDRFGRMREAMLHERDDAFRLLANNVGDAITRHNADGRVTFASPSSSTVLGADPADLSEHGLRERIHLIDRVGYLQALRAASEGSEETVEFRIKAPGAEGGSSYRYVEMRCRPLNDDTGGVVAVTRDVQDRKDYAEALLAAREEADRASGAKMQFLASVSHELRTPLNAVIGFSDMLSGEMLEMLTECQRKEYAQLINQSGKHLLQVVNDVLDMSKIEAGHFTVTLEGFDPAAAARDCCHMLSSQFTEGGLTLIEDFDELPELVADGRAFRQMLINLLSNAQKFTEPGGRVTLSLTPVGRNLRVQVADTGIGISKEDLPRLGQPFVQAETSYSRRYEGTGLGLSVVRGLVELHQGSFELASDLGVGTTVTITLPLDPNGGATVSKLPIREVA
ncbi:MAG: ATP-binding protein, partial [Pseudomonadota bacterium]